MHVSVTFNCTWCLSFFHLQAIIGDYNHIFRHVSSFWQSLVWLAYLQNEMFFHDSYISESTSICLENRLQRVLLNDLTPSWETESADVPKRSILGYLHFVIYINNLFKDLLLLKIFADDTPICSSVQDIKHSTDQLNCDLDLISKWLIGEKCSRLKKQA